MAELGHVVPYGPPALDRVEAIRPEAAVGGQFNSFIDPAVRAVELEEGAGRGGEDLDVISTPCAQR